MCGIAGIVGTLDSQHQDALHRMERALLHRGPDAGATWTSPPDADGWGCLLAHRRLSILDLAPTGAQPMIEPRTGDVIIANGEIYNYTSLRSDLRRRGEEFRSTGDTEVDSTGDAGPADVEIVPKPYDMDALVRIVEGG